MLRKIRRWLVPDFSTKKKRMDFLLGLILLYIGICGMLYVRQRSLLYFPDRHGGSFAAQGARPADVKTADGLSLRGWYVDPAPGQPVALLFHGNAGNIYMRGYMAAPFVQHGAGMLFAEYRGYGGNPGAPTQDGLFADARAYIDWLKGQGITPDRMIMYGESLGTGVAVRMAAENDPVYAVILEAPYSSLTYVAQKHYPLFPASLILEDRFDSLSQFPKITAPVLMIHGRRDRVVPFHNAEILKAAGGENVRLEALAEADHNTLAAFGGQDLIASFIREIKTNKQAQP